jgi:predicted protein tyrosine phosphatase
MEQRDSELTVEVFSRGEAGEILESEACADITFLISIGEAHNAEPPGYENVRHKLRLLFADSSDPLSGPTEEVVQQIIDVARRLAQQGGRVVAHCEAGVSRSAAAAVITYAVALGPGREWEAVHRVLQQRPIARPNRRMIEIADDLLDLRGDLVRAVDEAVQPS